MDQLVPVGSFCPNESCADYGQVGLKNVIHFGKTRKGVQRYRCHSCGKTFTATHGTLFYRRRTPANEILQTLALLAEGSRISSLSRAKGFKADAILDWLREAARHAEAVAAVLLQDYRLKQAQIDALWTYVGHKGEKGGPPPSQSAANSGG